MADHAHSKERSLEEAYDSLYDESKRARHEISTFTSSFGDLTALLSLFKDVPVNTKSHSSLLQEIVLLSGAHQRPTEQLQESSAALLGKLTEFNAPVDVQVSFSRLFHWACGAVYLQSIVDFSNKRVNEGDDLRIGVDWFQQRSNILLAGLEEQAKPKADTKGHVNGSGTQATGSIVRLGPADFMPPPYTGD